MKRIFFMFIVMCLFLFLLAGCSANRTDMDQRSISSTLNDKTDNEQKADDSFKSSSGVIGAASSESAVEDVYFPQEPVGTRQPPFTKTVDLTPYHILAVKEDGELVGCLLTSLPFGEAFKARILTEKNKNAKVGDWVSILENEQSVSIETFQKLAGFCRLHLLS